MIKKFRISERHCRAVSIALLALGMSACSTKILQADKSDEMLKTSEFENQISIREIPADEQPGAYVKLPGLPVVAPAPGASPILGPITAGTAGQAPPAKPTRSSRNTRKPLVGRKAPKTPQAPPPSVEVASPQARQPSLEDSEGFVGRRPLKDPFRIGEKTVLEVSYFNVVAGDMAVEVRPFVQVNGKKSYHFVGTASSSSVFSMFYAVNDWFETFVDYDSLVPYSYALHVKETKQLRETRTLFDWARMKAVYWDKKINSEKKLEEKKEEWDLPAFSQNVFSAVFYLRNFTLTPGKKIAFRLSHEKENLVVTGEVLRREHISTDAGEFDTVVLKPKIELNGVFKPVGDIFMWMTDDDRHLLVRMESKIKIGTIIAVAKHIELGGN